MFKKLATNQRHTGCAYCNYHGCIEMRSKYGQTAGHLLSLHTLYTFYTPLGRQIGYNEIKLASRLHLS